MGPLSFAAAVAGLLTLTSTVAKGLSNLASAKVNTRRVINVARSEVRVIELALVSLNKLVTGEVAIQKPRASLIQLHDLGTVITDCVLTLSELDSLLKGAGLERLRHLLTSQTARFEDSLLDRLQRHKESLTLTLTIVQWCVLVL